MTADYYGDTDYDDHDWESGMTMPSPPTGESFEWKANKVNTWSSKDEQAMYEQARALGESLDAWCMWQIAHKLEIRPLHHVQRDTLRHLDDLIDAIDERRPLRSSVIEENVRGRLLTHAFNPHTRGGGTAA